jgi:hypothetical protein
MRGGFGTWRVAVAAFACTCAAAIAIPGPASATPLAASTRTSGALAVQEAAIKQTWGSVKLPAALGGSFVTDKWSGATYKYKFFGTSLKWYTITGPDQGGARVEITNPGGPKITKLVNNYAPTTTIDAQASFTGLANSSHTITITVLNESQGTDTWVAVDGFAIDSGVVPSPHAKTAFATLPNGLGGSYAYASNRGATFAMTFEGSGFSWIALVGPEFGKAKVTLDGSLLATVDLYGREYAWTNFSFPANPGVHTLKITALGTKNGASSDTTITLDEIQIF